MNNWGKEKSDLTDNVTIKDWITHFENILSDNNAPTLSINEEFMTFDPNLDRKI